MVQEVSLKPEAGVNLSLINYLAVALDEHSELDETMVLIDRYNLVQFRH